MKPLQNIFLHLTILSFVTIKVIYLNWKDGGYIRSVHRLFNYLFFPDQEDFSGFTSKLFSIQDTAEAFDKVLANYYSIDKLSTTKFLYSSDNSESCGNSPAPIRAETVYWNNPNSVGSYVNYISDSSDWSFITQNSTEYFKKLDSLVLTFYLCNTIAGSELSSSCYRWEVNVVYQIIGQMYINVQIFDDISGICEEQNNAFKNHLLDFTIWFNVVLLLMGTVYLYLECKEIYKAYSKYVAVKTIHARERKAYLSGLAGHSIQSSPMSSLAVQYDWSDIPTGVKRYFHCYWSVFTVIGTLMMLASCLYELGMGYRYLPTSTTDKFLTGLSCLLFWGCATQFLERWGALYAFVMTLGTSIPRILAYFVGVVPLFMGFAFLSMTLFGPHLGMFGSLARACSTLFSIMNGDVILPVLTLMEFKSYWAAVLFGVSFIIVMAYLILNILIAIVEEAYFLARTKRRYLEQLMRELLLGQVSENATMQNRPSAGLPLRRQSISDPVMKHPVPLTAAEEEDQEHEKVAEEDEEQEDDDDEENEWFPNAFHRHGPNLRLAKQEMALTEEEEIAEVYILGQTHWEYSKMMDYLVENVS